ncbi:MAG: plasmid stabilization protein [Solirubrobacterales bacterium]
MPPRGVRKGTKRARQYEKIKRSARKRGAPKGRAKQLAARTVQKNRARSGESRTRSRSSTKGASPSRRGGRRSGTNRPKGQTKEQLYNQARRLRISGRSSMSKAQLQRAVAAKRR